MAPAKERWTHLLSRNSSTARCSDAHVTRWASPPRRGHDLCPQLKSPPSHCPQSLRTRLRAVGERQIIGSLHRLARRIDDGGACAADSVAWGEKLAKDPVWAVRCATLVAAKTGGSHHLIVAKLLV